MKAEVGDYIKTPSMDFPLKVTRADEDYQFYEMENASVISDTEITYDDVLLPSEVIL